MLRRRGTRIYRIEVTDVTSTQFKMVGSEVTTEFIFNSIIVLVALSGIIDGFIRLYSGKLVGQGPEVGASYIAVHGLILLLLLFKYIITEYDIVVTDICEAVLYKERAALNKRIEELIDSVIEETNERAKKERIISYNRKAIHKAMRKKHK